MGVAAAIGTAAVGMYSANKQAKAAKSAGKAAASAADPFGPYRPEYAERMSAFMSDPEAFKGSPGYLFRMNQGMQQVDRRLSSKGQRISGNRLIDLTTYAQGLASDEYNNEYQRLAQLSGASTGSPAAAGQQMMAGSRDAAGYKDQMYNSLGYGMQAAGNYFGGGMSYGQQSFGGTNAMAYGTGGIGSSFMGGF